MTFLNSLSSMQWALLAAVPPLIISLYFLKLKRQPLEVPSTFLWSRTIEDLHVNSIWQRLRQSLLLFLQLLAVVLLILALLRPGWKGAKLLGDRFIFLIDNSASMAATDIDGRSRLAESQRRISALIEEMEAGEEAMIISFSDTANVEQMFTDNHRLLQRKVKQLKPTNRTTNPQKALRYAAGLANPGRSSNPDDIQDDNIRVAEAKPATLYIFSDGGFEQVKDFSLGNLEPVYVSIGSDTPHNLAIVAFAADRNPERPEESQAFARIENGGVVDAEIAVTLRYEGNLLDSQRHSVPAGKGVGVTFPLSAELEAGVLKAALERDGSGERPYDDDLSYDNIAYAPINPPRRARVLLVSPGNEPWELALGTERVQQLAEVSIAEPAILKAEAFNQQAAEGVYDLIIFDMCSPTEMPSCNTMFLGSIPPGDVWKAEPFEAPPLLLDSDRTNPLMLMLDMTGLLVADGFDVQPPSGGAKLLEADLGTLLAIAPRRGYEDAVLGFGFFEYKDGKPESVLTNWHTRSSFPVFVMNVVKYLGGSRAALATKPVKPGQPLKIRSLSPVDVLAVTTPDGEKISVYREAMGSFQFSQTAKQGVYDVTEGESDEVSQRFAVNLFDRRESSLLPEEEIKIEHEKVAGQRTTQPVRRELWKWILLGAIVLLTFEWYVYNRRVYL